MHTWLKLLRKTMLRHVAVATQLFVEMRMLVVCHRRCKRLQKYVAAMALMLVQSAARGSSHAPRAGGHLPRRGARPLWEPSSKELPFFCRVGHNSRPVRTINLNHKTKQWS